MNIRNKTSEFGLARKRYVQEKKGDVGGCVMEKVAAEEGTGMVFNTTGLPSAETIRKIAAAPATISISKQGQPNAKVMMPVDKRD